MRNGGRRSGSASDAHRPRSSTSRIHSREEDICPHRSVYTSLCHSLTYGSQEWTQPRCPGSVTPATAQRDLGHVMLGEPSPSQKPHSVCFCLYEPSTTGDSIETERRILEAAKGRGPGRRSGGKGGVANGHRVSFWGDSVLSVVMESQLWESSKSHHLYSDG